jgi:hypothetical protein
MDKHKDNINVGLQGSNNVAAPLAESGMKEFVEPKISTPLDVRETTTLYFLVGTPVTDTGDV